MIKMVQVLFNFSFLLVAMFGVGFILGRFTRNREG